MPTVSTLGVPEIAASDQYRAMTLPRIVTATLVDWSQRQLPFGNGNSSVDAGFQAQIHQAQEYLDCYRHSIHAALPFLDLDTCTRNLDATMLVSSTGPSLPLSLSALDSLALMALAIGAVIQDIRSLERSCHPALCARAARRNMDAIIKKESSETLQLLLLLTVFSLYDPCGGNSWQLAGLAVQVAIALGFHQIPQNENENLNHDPNVRAFWAIFMAVDCPCGISDDDITSPMVFLHADFQDPRTLSYHNIHTLLQAPPDSNIPILIPWQQLGRLSLLARIVAHQSQPQDEHQGAAWLQSDFVHFASDITIPQSGTAIPCHIGLLLALHLIMWSLGPPFATPALQLQRPPAATHHATYVDLAGHLDAEGVQRPWIIGYSLVHSSLVDMMLQQMLSMPIFRQDSCHPDYWLVKMRDQTRSSVVHALARQFPDLSMQALAEVVRGVPSQNLPLRVELTNTKTARLLGSLNALTYS
ncbi:hypothetical protein BDW74DRAFT_179024 [Aspergillus multicolor]|uniref:fungal specific transcription factor domain-containing protein n=1 Tax=Aspergillus multicolor TaxID=41759 RepID=UPI003CCDB1E9